MPARSADSWRSLLGAALLYHALNGMRILIIDLWPSMTVHHRKLWWASWVIFVVVGIPGALIILRPLLEGLPWTAAGSLPRLTGAAARWLTISPDHARPVKAHRQSAARPWSGT